MKKTLLTLSSLTALVLSAGVAQAAPPTAELKVVGELTVPTCEVTSVNDGVYDIGKQSSSLVKPAATTALDAITQTWTVTCNAATYLNFEPIDNRAASKSNSTAGAFGLGKVNTEGKIGYFTAQAKNAKVDGVASNLFTSATATFTPAATAWLNNGNKTGWATSVANTQIAGKVFIADITVNPVLASSADMKGAIADTADIDGSVTLNFAYGI